MELDYVRVILSLLVSVALGVAVVYFMSRQGIGLGRKGKSAQRIEVLEVRPLGNRTSLVAVQYSGSEVLLVVGPGFATVAATRSALDASATTLNSQASPDAHTHDETVR